MSGPQNLGNDALKAGLRNKKKFYLRQAIEQYDKGLQVQCADAALNSILCSNRAHVNLLLGNFRNAYQDGLAALRHNDGNVKVGSRAVDHSMLLHHSIGGLHPSRACLEMRLRHFAAQRSPPPPLPGYRCPAGFLPGSQGGPGAAKVRSLHGAVCAGLACGPRQQ